MNKRRKLLFCLLIVTLTFPVFSKAAFTQTTTISIVKSQAPAKYGIVGGNPVQLQVKVTDIIDSDGLAAFSFDKHAS